MSGRPGARKPGPGLLATRDVVRLLGVSYRIVDYWARTSVGPLCPTVNGQGQGSTRGYSPDDVTRLRKAMCLTRALGPMSGSAACVRIEAVERFVREAVENTDGDWVWECDDFTLIVAGEASRIEANFEAS